VGTHTDRVSLDRIGRDLGEDSPATLGRRLWVLTGISYLGISVVLTILAMWGSHFGRRPPLHPRDAFTDLAWVDAWVRYDSGWYAGIAELGYGYTPGQQSAVAFFPAYPTAMRIVGTVLNNVSVAGYLITIVSGFLAVALFHLWCRQWLPSRSAVAAVAALLLYPYSLYLYGAVYADALFLVSAIAAFVLLERGHPVLAGLTGALATAGRPVGVALVIGLAVRAIEIANARRDEIRQTHIPTGETLSARAGQLRDRMWSAVRSVRLPEFGVLLSLLGLVTWCVYLAIRFDEPLAFVHAQSAPGWDQETGPRTWFKIHFFYALLEKPASEWARLALAAIFCLIAFLLLPRVHRLFGWGYATYAFFMVAIPVLSTKDFMGTGRYLIAAFPVFAAAGDLLARSSRRWVLPLALAASFVTMCVLTWLYGANYQVS
jgi:hypothetical protein